AAVIADDAPARPGDRAHFGVQRAADHRAVGVPVALGREAVAVHERAEDAVTAGDRIADHLDQAIGARGRIHHGAVADRQLHEARLALRGLRLAAQVGAAPRLGV